MNQESLTFSEGVSIEKVQAFGYHHVVAKILVTNPQSIKFHQRFGFEMVGIQKEIGYYRGKWLDVAIMQLIFPDVAPMLLKEG